MKLRGSSYINLRGSRYIKLRKSGYTKLREIIYTKLLEITYIEWWRSCWRHCAKRRKVASSIPNGVIGIYDGHYHSGRTMALGLTQPLTEVSTRNISWGIKAVSA
jgi:hypothetical protein